MGQHSRHTHAAFERFLQIVDNLDTAPIASHIRRRNLQVQQSAIKKNLNHVPKPGSSSFSLANNVRKRILIGQPTLRFNPVENVILNIQRKIQILAIMLSPALEPEVFDRLDLLSRRLIPVVVPSEVGRIGILILFDPAIEYRRLAQPAHHASG